MMVSTAVSKSLPLFKTSRSNKETKAEQFLRKSTLFREDTFIKMHVDGVTAYVKVATDLVTNQKIGYCYFETEADRSALFFTGGKEGEPESLGYLDVEEIDDMILAINKILEDKSQNLLYSTGKFKFGVIDFIQLNDKKEQLISQLKHH